MPDQGRNIVLSSPVIFSGKTTSPGDMRRGCNPLQKDSVVSDSDIKASKVGRTVVTQPSPLRELPRLSGKRRHMSREPVRYWTEEEHKLFLIGVQKFGGRNYKALSEHIKTRTPTQVRTHLQKYLLKIQVRDLIMFSTFRAFNELRVRVQMGRNLTLVCPVAESKTTEDRGSCQYLQPSSRHQYLTVYSWVQNSIHIALTYTLLRIVQVSPDPSEAGDSSSGSSGQASTGDPANGGAPPSNGGTSSADAAPPAASADDDNEIDETALVEVFEEMANESRSNTGSQGLNKNCHFCGMYS